MLNAIVWEGYGLRLTDCGKGVSSRDCLFRSLLVLSVAFCNALGKFHQPQERKDNFFMMGSCQKVKGRLVLNF